VGCDHGYLAVHLAQSGGHPAVYASDAAALPLESARRSAAAYGVAERIKFFLCDGVPPELAERLGAVVAAGMGGETIAGILERAPWLRCCDVTLILQPQTKLDKLRDYLLSHEWIIPRLAQVTEGWRKYTVITAKYAVR
jgi:tRNA (adenine22-N1)-methyltransferase